MKNKDILIAMAVSLILGGLSFMASSAPDGLERVATDKNFLTKAYSAIKSPMPEYLFPGMPEGKVTTALAGILGVTLIYFLGTALAKLLMRDK